MAITCRASSKHPEMPQVVLLLKMPWDITSWTGTQVANHSWPLARVLRAAPLILNERGNILTDTETDEQQGRPPRPKAPTAPRRANTRGRKENPLPAVRINSLEVHRGYPRPDQRSAYRENISVVTRGYRWEVAGPDLRGYKLYQQGEKS